MERAAAVPEATRCLNKSDLTKAMTLIEEIEEIERFLTAMGKTAKQSTRISVLDAAASPLATVRGGSIYDSIKTVLVTRRTQVIWLLKNQYRIDLHA